eukprot:3825193-Rhodomonas_salina.2
MADIGCAVLRPGADIGCAATRCCSRSYPRNTSSSSPSGSRRVQGLESGVCAISVIAMDHVCYAMPGTDVGLVCYAITGTKSRPLQPDELVGLWH